MTDMFILRIGSFFRRIKVKIEGKIVKIMLSLGFV
jgi:hypothetical protein